MIGQYFRLSEPAPSGAVIGQLVAVPAYLPEPGPNGQRTGEPEVPPIPPHLANAILITVEWAGYPSTARGGKVWEG